MCVPPNNPSAIQIWVLEVVSCIFVECHIMFNFCPCKFKMAPVIRLICAFIADDWNAFLIVFPDVFTAYLGVGTLAWWAECTLLGHWQDLLWLWWNAFSVTLFLELLQNHCNKLYVFLYPGPTGAYSYEQHVIKWHSMLTCNFLSSVILTWHMPLSIWF